MREPHFPFVFVSANRADRKDQFGQTKKYTVVDVIPETGKAARMRKHNVFAGQVRRIILLDQRRWRTPRKCWS